MSKLKAVGYAILLILYYYVVGYIQCFMRAIVVSRLMNKENFMEVYHSHRKDEYGDFEQQWDGVRILWEKEGE